MLSTRHCLYNPLSRWITGKFAELSMATKSSLTFYYSIGSRYSYLACTQIEQLEWGSDFCLQRSHVLGNDRIVLLKHHIANDA